MFWEPVYIAIFKAQWELFDNTSLSFYITQFVGSALYSNNSASYIIAVMDTFEIVHNIVKYKQFCHSDLWHSDPRLGSEWHLPPLLMVA